MMRRLPAREQRALLAAVGLAVLVGWLYTAFILLPLFRETGRLGQQVGEARARVRDLKLLTVNEAALQGEYEQLQQRVGTLRALLPDQEELPLVIGRLSELASEAQMKIQTIFPQRSAWETAGAAAATPPASKQPAVFEEMLIHIEAATGYHHVGRFLSLAETDDRPLRVAKLRMISDPKDYKQVNVTLLLEVYFATPAAGATKQRPASSASGPR
jgi:Tfp pilus assembly protein PilO